MKDNFPLMLAARCPVMLPLSSTSRIVADILSILDLLFLSVILPYVIEIQGREGNFDRLSPRLIARAQMMRTSLRLVGAGLRVLERVLSNLPH
eukprot:2255635-Amphidinium_carterae.1